MRAVSAPRCAIGLPSSATTCAAPVRSRRPGRRTEQEGEFQSGKVQIQANASTTRAPRGQVPARVPAGLRPRSGRRRRRRRHVDDPSLSGPRAGARRVHWWGLAVSGRPVAVSSTSPTPAGGAHADDVGHGTSERTRPVHALRGSRSTSRRRRLHDDVPTLRELHHELRRSAAYDTTARSRSSIPRTSTWTYTFGNTLPAGFPRDLTPTVGAQVEARVRGHGPGRESDPRFRAERQRRHDDQGGDTTTAQCNACHDPLAEHGGGRREVKLCVLCHTNQHRAESGNTLDFAHMVHRMHRGKGPARVGGRRFGGHEVRVRRRGRLLSARRSSVAAGPFESAPCARRPIEAEHMQRHGHRGHRLPAGHPQAARRPRGRRYGGSPPDAAGVARLHRLPRRINPTRRR